MNNDDPKVGVVVNMIRMWIRLDLIKDGQAYMIYDCWFMEQRRFSYENIECGSNDDCFPDIDLDDGCDGI